MKRREILRWISDLIWQSLFAFQFLYVSHRICTRGTHFITYFAITRPLWFILACRKPALFTRMMAWSITPSMPLCLASKRFNIATCTGSAIRLFFFNRMTCFFGGLSHYLDDFADSLWLTLAALGATQRHCCLRFAPPHVFIPAAGQ